MDDDKSYIQEGYTLLHVQVHHRTYHAYIPDGELDQIMELFETNGKHGHGFWLPMNYGKDDGKFVFINTYHVKHIYVSPDPRD